MRKRINKTLLAMLLITSAMSLVSCEAIAAQNITHNDAAAVSGNQDRAKSETNTNPNTNNRPGANGNADRNANQGANGNKVK